jgi:Uma2 family endonuclease
MTALPKPAPDFDSRRIPPLESGDHLSRAEFERRYAAMPEVKKAELIEGVVRMPSPVRWNHHGRPHFRFGTWLGVYAANTPGVDGGDNVSIRLDLDNEPQPDDALIILPAHGGRVRISEDDYIEGSPELAAEVAASSVSFDLHQKLRVYRRNQVLEYIVWRVLDQAIDWFILRNDDYVPLAPHPDGYLESEVFPGLRLDVAAMTRFDMAIVLKVLQAGIDSPEHARFVERLARK